MLLAAKLARWGDRLLTLAAALLLGRWHCLGVVAVGHRRHTPRGLPEQTLQFKPLAAAPTGSPGFAELRANPDVCGWLTLDGTRIDFPVVQGADNMVYVNTDVYGDFSLSGAIFLDSRCPADFTAPYSIVYGHHIEDGGMFGDIVQFTQSDYFAAHTTGTLITDDTAYNIALFACVRADAYDPVLYDPAQSPDALLAYIKAHAVQYRTPGSGPVVAFSTCTEAATNGRVLLFGQLLPQT
ncbi:MAG: class B sortase [Gemmiger sp.]